jgi:hypothetical protein
MVSYSLKRNAGAEPTIAAKQVSPSKPLTQNVLAPLTSPDTPQEEFG